LKQPFRIGFGYDVHAFEHNRPLILGGVEIPYEKGLKGHSDADALLHAITDALLGAVSLGDIGKHFPDTDPAYKGADSKILLQKSYELVLQKGYVLGNIDSTLIIEKPKMAPHIEKMKSTISELLKCETNQISVKATTSERMGFVGNEDGVKALATVILIRSEE
jgi:2-C-methyl-D-erythritol 2,4-cyclodiphosphate synthase